MSEIYPRRLWATFYDPNIEVVYQDGSIWDVGTTYTIKNHSDNSCITYRVIEHTRGVVKSEVVPERELVA